MTNVVQLDSNYFVAPQVTEADLAGLKAQGFEQIINNRPEGESEDQPTGDAIQSAVESLGMLYVNNPIALPKLSQSNIDNQNLALAAGKKTLAFCRTGTRSSVLWVLIEQAKGNNYDELVTVVSGKGFDLNRCAPAMTPFVKG